MQRKTQIKRDRQTNEKETERQRETQIDKRRLRDCSSVQ